MGLKLVLVLCFVIFGSIPCFGVSTYKGLLPGVSTRGDAEKVLGQPVQAVSSMLFEYAAPRGGGKLLVEYRGNDAVIDRIERTFAKAISRAALVRALKLPDQPKDKRTNKKGQLVEYFNDMKTFALTYASDQPESGVISLGYYSLRLFAANLEKARNPLVQFDPAACKDVYLWAQREKSPAKRSKNVIRHQAILEILILSQRGDCRKATELAVSYRKNYL